MASVSVHEQFRIFQLELPTEQGENRAKWDSESFLKGPKQWF